MTSHGASEGLWLTRVNSGKSSTWRANVERRIIGAKVATSGAAKSPPFAGETSAPPPQVQIDGREVFDPLWLSPAAALEKYHSGTLNLPPPTASTLEDLAAEITAARQHPDAAESLLHAVIGRCAIRLIIYLLLGQAYGRLRCKR